MEIIKKNRNITVYKSYQKQKKERFDMKYFQFNKKY